MELVNKTPLAAEICASELDPSMPRIGMLTAKATYRFTLDGEVEPELDEPVPLFPKDEETELGLLPGDRLPHDGPGFEVILLGRAHALSGAPVPRMRVAVEVGAARRELHVSGDREWEAPERGARGARIPEPEPFASMPLTWERAFGGQHAVEVAPGSRVLVAEPNNPAGRGFDPEPAARELGEAMAAPAGFPRFDRRRPLPNVEHSDRLIASWEDAPPPACWAAVPLASALHAGRVPYDPDRPEEATSFRLRPESFQRAHPDWIIDLPERGGRVVLEGLTPRSRVELALPELRVVADYVAGDRRGQRELRPQMLVLLPEEARFYLLFRTLFNFPFQPGGERCMRLRTESGWFESGEER